ncbi:hypothetical protein EQG49_06785 [Periweissella cryptocerci]|uniref:Uncharacterized protein n=1 Tax=Periweissella cryptocerci TaxID=2506420 RepID=A0A4P6YU40_9LACO|nr:hypothetical protein [Periweissella cryptocerci]QBO36187.1 hypothetical protein EQG49_06785 [Periweissella cryptocerci]
MDEQVWLLTTIKELEDGAVGFNERALLHGLQAVAQEQLERIDQSSGELDGRIWNPGKWS